jgi:hypothetical protein
MPSGFRPMGLNSSPSKSKNPKVPVSKLTLERREAEI